MQSNTLFFQKVSISLVKPLLILRNSVTMKDFSVPDRRRCKNWAHKNQLLRISNYLKTCPVSFPGAQVASFLRCLEPCSGFPRLQSISHSTAQGISQKSKLGQEASLGLLDKVSSSEKGLWGVAVLPSSSLVPYCPWLCIPSSRHPQYPATPA